MATTVTPPWVPTADRLRTALDDRYEEMIRLNRALKGLVMPVDLLVVSEQEFEHRSATPGTIEHVARREGRVLYAG
jgi:hypothetical protein